MLQPFVVNYVFFLLLRSGSGDGKTALSRAELMKRLSSRRLLGDAAGEEAESTAIMREMMERHAMELAKLENELRSEEISKINEVSDHLQGAL